MTPWFSAAPTALGSSSILVSQPFRAGLTFGTRPSGPCIHGAFCRVFSPSICCRQVEMLLMTRRTVGVRNNPTQAKRRLEGHPKLFLRVRQLGHLIPQLAA